MEGKGKGMFHGEQRGAAFPMESAFMGEGGRERSASRMTKGNGFISVDAEVSLCGWLFRGHYSGVNLRPESLESVYDPHAWSQEILAAGLVSSSGSDGAASCT